MTDESHEPHDAVEMPRPTSWPIVLALAVTLLFVGIVTSKVFMAAGLVLFVIASIGWVRQVLMPSLGEYHEALVPVEQRPQEVRVRPGVVRRIEPGMPGHRFRVPEKIHPYSAGAKGGLIGGAAMTVPAFVYGVLSYYGLFVALGIENEPRTIWLPVNLLASMVLAGEPTLAELNAFNAAWLVLGLVIHVVSSLALGLIYGVILPMLPGRPIFWGGVVAPFLWTGAIYSLMRAINPVLAEYVHWPAFITSQFIYGLVVGFVVVRSEEVYVAQSQEVEE